VRGVDRVIKRCECGRPIRTKKAKAIGLIMRSDGYPRVSLSKKNRYVQRCVHHLVLEAFVGPRPLGADACHNNGVRSDSRLENLRWDTRKNNHADRWAHGTMLLGEQTNNVKLTEAEVVAIRKSDYTHLELADLYGVARGTIQRIRSRKTWRHVAEGGK